MSDEYVNKVALGNESLIDISDTTATESDVLPGMVFYAQNGARTVGTAHIPPDMTILSYGNSTWDDFISVYETNSVVYCRASSNSNPATGSQTRLAFMAYVNNATTPTEVEFQYYRSVATHTDAQQGDQVYVYKLNKTSGWSVTVRSAFSKVVAGTGLTSSYASGAITLNLSPSTATCTLGTTGWSDNSITVSVTGVTASNTVIVSPSPASTADYAAAGIVCTAQAAGTLTFTRTSDNTSSITVNVLILS